MLLWYDISSVGHFVHTYDTVSRRVRLSVTVCTEQQQWTLLDRIVTPAKGQPEVVTRRHGKGRKNFAVNLLKQNQQANKIYNYE